LETKNSAENSFVIFNRRANLWGLANSWTRTDL